MFMLANEETYSNGQIIFNENSPGDWVYIIISGNVEIFRSIGGKKYILGHLKAGDVFGEYHTDFPLKQGDKIELCDAGGYTMVKMNWFNGLNMPSIIIKRLDGSYETVKNFSYQDFKNNLGSTTGS